MTPFPLDFSIYTQCRGVSQKKLLKRWCLFQVCKIPPGCSLKIFNNQEFATLLTQVCYNNPWEPFSKIFSLQSVITIHENHSQKYFHDKNIFITVCQPWVRSSVRVDQNVHDQVLPQFLYDWWKSNFKGSDMPRVPWSSLRYIWLFLYLWSPEKLTWFSFLIKKNNNFLKYSKAHPVCPFYFLRYKWSFLYFWSTAKLTRFFFKLQKRLNIFWSTAAKLTRFVPFIVDPVCSAVPARVGDLKKANAL